MRISTDIQTAGKTEITNEKTRREEQRASELGAVKF